MAKLPEITGFWKLETNDANWDDYMKATGVGFALRQIGKRISSWEDIKVHGDTWTLDITSTFKNTSLKFKLGEEFDETLMDGRRVQSIFNVEAEKLVHFQTSTDVGIPNTVITRERTDDTTMRVTFEATGKGVKATRIFSKQPDRTK